MSIKCILDFACHAFRHIEITCFIINTHDIGTPRRTNLYHCAHWPPWIQQKTCNSVVSRLILIILPNFYGFCVYLNMRLARCAESPLVNTTEKVGSSNRQNCPNSSWSISQYSKPLRSLTMFICQQVHSSCNRKKSLIHNSIIDLRNHLACKSVLCQIHFPLQ